MTDKLTYQMLKAAGDKARLKKASFTLFANFIKAEEQDDGSIIVSGLASSESKDSDGEIITADAMRAALPDYRKWANIREMHSNIAAGKALSIDVNDAGETELEAKIVNTETCKKIREGVLQGFSIGGRKVEYDKTDRHIITGIKLSEISVVDRPANPDCRFEIAKFEDLQKDMYTVGTFASMLQSIAWMIQSCQSEADFEGDQSTLPKKLREWLSLGTEIFGEMTEEETQEMLVAAAGPEGMPLKGASKDAGKAFQAHLMKRWETHNHGQVAVSKEAAAMADELMKYGKELDAAIKSFKDVEAAHKAHKDCADSFHSAAKDASSKDAADSAKDSIGKAFKDVMDAIKSHKDACDAHKDACGKLHKAIMGSVKDDSSKSEEIEDLKKVVQGMTAAFEGMMAKFAATPAPSPTELAAVAALAKLQGKEAGPLDAPEALPELDPKDPLYEIKKAARGGLLV